MKIKFSNEDFILDISGLLIWKKLKLGIVSDLHLERAKWETYFPRKK